MNKRPEIRIKEEVALLQDLIATPSYSREEDATAGLIVEFFRKRHISQHRMKNNVWALNAHFDPAKPSILLNSHHDTVMPNPQYTRDPFDPQILDGKLFGLGSNDAGAALISLIATFCYYAKQKDLAYNLVMAATAEEEISGANGLEALLKDEQFHQSLGKSRIEFAIVGEPTQMQMAVAERGLMVLDAVAHGRAGHAARDEGDNAILTALKDIEWLTHYRFPRESELLGPNKMTVTVIETENKAHNVVPSSCHFVIDTRINELYSFEEVIEIIRKNIKSEIVPRSTRLRSTSIALDHPIVKAGMALGKTCYGSPTTSDKALMPFPALKMGPGDSARSHSPNEYIYIDEIEKGVDDYIALLKQVL